MNKKALTLTEPPEGYTEWLADLKSRVQTARQRAALAANTELLRLYWRIGRDILERQSDQGWGAKVIDRLSHDLRLAFPEMTGLSSRNLRSMRDFARAWPDAAIWQQAVAKLPWGHNLVLLSKLASTESRLAYAAATLEHGWSRNALAMNIEAKTLERQGRATTNFDRTMPPAESDLAHQMVKDPYKLEFLEIGSESKEREIEQALVDHVADFLIELGAGFAFVGRQVHVEVGGDDFYVDLLFYHLKLRAYVVIEIKSGKFKPDHIGQLGFYMTAVDTQVKHEDDAPTIGLLLCKTRNAVVAEYALRDHVRPLGVTEYQIAESLPERIHGNLPSVEQIERELSGDGA
jgi:predicted nuclease of restriction endonuclease-like (RecB) superfamily